MLTYTLFTFDPTLPSCKPPELDIPENSSSNFGILENHNKGYLNQQPNQNKPNCCSSNRGNPSSRTKTEETTRSWKKWFIICLAFPKHDR